MRARARCVRTFAPWLRLPGLLVLVELAHVHKHALAPPPYGDAPLARELGEGGSAETVRRNHQAGDFVDTLPQPPSQRGGTPRSHPPSPSTERRRQGRGPQLGKGGLEGAAPRTPRRLPCADPCPPHAPHLPWSRAHLFSPHQPPPRTARPGAAAGSAGPVTRRGAGPHRSAPCPHATARRTSSRSRSSSSLSRRAVESVDAVRLRAAGALA